MDDPRKRKLENPSETSARKRLRQMPPSERHLLFSIKPDDTQLANLQEDSKGSKKRPADKAGLGATEEPPRKKFRPGEEKYLNDLIRSEELLKKRQEELDELDGRSDFFGDAQDIYEKYKKILGKFKSEAKYVREKAIEKGLNSIPENLIKSWESAYRVCKHLEDVEPKLDSTPKYWDEYLKDYIHRVKQLQNSVVPIAELFLARAKKDDQTDDIHILLRQFIKRIKKSEDSTQKQQRLQLYQECLQNDEQSFAKLQTSLQSMQEAHSRGDVVHIGPLLTKLSDYKKNIMAIGSLIESDCPQSHAETASKDIESLKSNYKEAVKNYEELKEKDKTLSPREQISNALTKISLMVDIVRKTHQHYSELAKSAISAQAKGKERALTASPVREDTVMKDISDSDQEERDRKRTQEEIDSKLAKELQEREYNSEAEEGHLSIIKKDEEYDLPGSEDGNRQRQSDLEAKSKSDKPMIKRDYQELTEKQKKLNTLYKKIEIMRMKLSAHLREPYLSPKEIGEVYELLIGTTRPRGYINLIHSVLDDDPDLAKQISFYKAHDLSDRNQCEDENIVKNVFNKIIEHQKYLSKKLAALPKDEMSEHERREYLNIFAKRMKLEQEKEEHFQECDIKVLKAEIRAKELEHDIIKERDYETMRYSTVAVAYMKDKKNKIVIVTSVNEKSSYLYDFIEKKLNKNEKLIKGKEGGERHAEQILLDYANDHNLTIEGLGVSRKCCPDCWIMILKSGEIIKPEAVSQMQPSQEQLDQDRQKIQDKIDTTYSDDKDDTYDFVEEDVNRDELDQDWTKDDSKLKIQKSTQKAIRNLLGEDYKSSNIDVNPILPTIKTFKGEDNLYITNSITYLARYLKENGIKDITVVGINDSWDKKAIYKGKLTPTIPRSEDTITPCWGTLYVFQENKTDNVFVYNTLRDFATDKKAGNYQNICNSLYKGKDIEGWTLVKKINKQSVFPDWLKEYHEPQFQESIQREIHNLLENKYKYSNINIDSILPTIKTFKVGKYLYMTNNSNSLERHLKSEGINDITHGNIQYSWEKGSISKGKLNPIIPKAEEEFTVCWQPLYVFQEEKTGNVFVYNTLVDFATDQNQNVNAVRDTLYNERAITGWNLIYKIDRNIDRNIE